MFLSFTKKKETKCISVQILKRYKRVAVSFSKMYTEYVNGKSDFAHIMHFH